MRNVVLREQAATKGLTVPEARAKAAAKRGPIVHDLVANDLVAEEVPSEMFTASSGAESDWRGSTSDLVTRNLGSRTIISNLLERMNNTPEAESRKSSTKTSDLGGEDYPWSNPDLWTRLDKT